MDSSELKISDQFDLDRNFFVLSSDHLEAVETRFYGYCIAADRIITGTDSTPPSSENLTPDGAYILVERSGDTIRIFQDFVGCYGLYLFREEDWWAISNSFLYLVDYVRQTHRITFNLEYADHFLVAGLSAQSYAETMVNEIQCLDRSSIVTIHIADRTIDYTLHDYMENTVAPDSQEGMDLIDRWFRKWSGLIRSLKETTDNISTDLSGGYDSRLVLGLFLGSGINLSDIYVHSSDDGLQDHPEDLEIASKIAGHYGFRLNYTGNLMNGYTPYSLNDFINLSFYTKLGFHTQMYGNRVRNTEYRYAFSGAGIVRDLSADLHSWKYEDTFIESQVKLGRSHGDRVAASVRAVLNRSFDGIRAKFRSFGRELNPEDACYCFYRETRNRTHYGKANVETWFGGSISLCPLLDSDLHRLRHDSGECRDQNLLISIIYDRFNPDLLDFRIQGGRRIEPATVAFAHKLNEKYPAKNGVDTADTGKGNARQTTMKEKQATTGQRPPCLPANARRDALREAFFSPEVRGTFEMLYTPMTWRQMSANWNATNFYPESKACIVLAICRIYQDCMANAWQFQPVRVSGYIQHLRNSNRMQRRGETTLEQHALLDLYITARIDVKNAGDETNKLQFLEVSDPECRIQEPAWFARGGHGYIVQSHNGKLHLRLQCMGSGILQLALRSTDVKTKNGQHILYWIDYMSLTVNGEHVISERLPICHDKPYKLQRRISDGDIVTVSAVWEPHDERLVHCS